MKKKSIFTVIIAVIVVVAIVVTVIIIKEDKRRSAETEENNRIESEAKAVIPIRFTYYEDYWKKYDLKNAVYKTQAEYETAVRNYIDQIAILLNKQDWYKKYTGIDTIYIGLVINDTDDVPNQGNLIFSRNNSKTAVTCDMNMSNTMFQHNRTQLIQLLTQLVTKKVTNTNNIVDVRTNGLEEGFYWYIQNYLGMGTGSLNYGLDIHNYLIEFTKKNKENADNNNNMNAIRDAVGDQKANSINRFASQKSYFNHDYWSSANYSFVDYLVNTYGIENVMKMMDGYDESIFYLFHQNGLSGMVADWEQYLEKYPCKLSWDEIQTQITGLKSTHGY